jgi:Integrase core domain
MLHGRFSGIGQPAAWIVVDIVRMADGRLAEHWDVIQDEATKEQSKGGRPMLSAWWVSLGIELVRSRPGCPQDNGGHERMHGDIMREIQSTIAANVEEQQRLCDDWRTEFNHVRPHEALGMKTPAEAYRPSSGRANVRAGGPPHDCQRRVVAGVRADDRAARRDDAPGAAGVRRAASQFGRQRVPSAARRWRNGLRH